MINSDLIERLRKADRWDAHFYSQGFGTSRDVKTPFEAADALEALSKDNAGLRKALEACELMIVMAGNTEHQGEPCRLIHANYANETLAEIWKCIPSHVERDPEMAALGTALNTKETGK